MSIMGELKFFLVLQVHQSHRGIFISQSQYAIKLLKKHGLDECVSMSTPMATERLDTDLKGTPTDQTTYRRMIGGLMYLTTSRPDIAFATFECARYQARPTVKHLKESSKKQDCTTMSTAEAEYVSLSAYRAQVIWMRTQLLDYGYKYNRIPMYCDSKSAIAISYNPVQHSKTKHIAFSSNLLRTCEKVIIMAQQQHAADVHPDELCPPNIRYDLLDANKKVDLEHFWHTLKEDGSKYRLKFMLDKKELTLTLDDFRTIFHLPQATDNNHNSFVPPPSVSVMVLFYKQVLGFTMKLQTSSSFKTTSLLQPLQTLILHEYNGRYGYSVCTSTARFMPRKSFRIHLSDTLHDVLVEIFSCYGVKHSKEHGGEERGNIQAQISTQIENAIANVIPSQVDASVRSYMSGHILHVHPDQSQTSSVPEQQYQLYLAMKAGPQLQQQDIAIWLALQMKFERNTVLQTTCRTHAVRPRDQDDPHDDAHPEGENSAKRQKTSEYEAYVSGESSSG
ncbi:hypothetical protein Tco_0008058 [Tanacetum coccineum]